MSLPVEQLAGLDVSAIQDWENDKYKPSERGIRALERAFGTKLRK